MLFTFLILNQQIYTVDGFAPIYKYVHLKMTWKRLACLLNIFKHDFQYRTTMLGISQYFNLDFITSPSGKIAEKRRNECIYPSLHIDDHNRV